MKRLPMGFLISLLMLVTTSTAMAACNNLLDYSHRLLASTKEADLCESYAGQVILVVNTASRCGFTSQFEGLENLYQRYKDDGLVVLGFPSNDFRQELDDEEDTAEVCYINYGVTFPMFATSGVRGDQANELFRQLAEHETEPHWNFNKYLIDRHGEVVGHFGSRVSPMDSPLEERVRKLLVD